MSSKKIISFLILIGHCVFGEKTTVNLLLKAAPNADGLYSEFVIVPRFNGTDLNVLLPRIFIDELDVSVIEPEFGITYELLTRSTLFRPKFFPEFLQIGDVEMLKKSSFDATHPTVILVGWGLKNEMRDMFKDALFNKGKKDVNLIYLDWETGSRTLQVKTKNQIHARHASDVTSYIDLIQGGGMTYLTDRCRVSAVGVHVAKLIDFLVDEGDMKLRSLKLIGHGLGAHIVGIAGKNVKSGKLSSIIGLDPAAPLFESSKIEERLCDTDAELVEVVHTNAGWLGISAPLGHIDFYPYGGTSQPGCDIDLISTCAHIRSCAYYAESIHNPTDFYAWKCDSYDDMTKGLCSVDDFRDVFQLGADDYVNGVYYLETDKSRWFAGGKPIELRAATKTDAKNTDLLKIELPVKSQRPDGTTALLRPSTLHQLNQMIEFDFADTTDFIYNKFMQPELRSYVIRLRIFISIFVRLFRDIVGLVWNTLKSLVSRNPV